MSLEPPEFDIVGFTDHINVLVKFPPVIPKILGGGVLKFYLSLIIEEQSGNIVKKVSGQNSSELAMNIFDALLLKKTFVGAPVWLSWLGICLQLST